MAAMLAPEAPPALRANHVMMAFSDMYSQAAYQGGALRKSLVECWLQEHHYAPVNLQTVLAHPRYDEFWAQLNTEPQAERVNVPGVFWGGWYDAFLQGTINSFVTVHNQGGPAARGKCRLIIGPWNHHDAEWLVKPEAAGASPRTTDPLRFFEYWLQGAGNGVPCDAPVYYYVMGDGCGAGNFWRSCGNWPPPATATDYYLHTDGTLRPEPPGIADASRSFPFDPRNPVPTVGGLNMYGSWGPMDQRGVETRDDVLLFTSEPLLRSVEVTGPVSVDLFISSDAPDTDFTAKLTDVYPDGRSILLCDGILRARFREWFDHDALLEPGTVYRLKIDLWSTSVVFNRGHRIRVAISSSNCPRFQPNPNTGRLPSEDPQTRIATNTVHLSPEHPSHIILPMAGERD
jgi:uncharacterized protein